MELKEIKAIIDLMTKNGLSEFELEKEGIKIRIKKGAGSELPTMTMVTRENGGGMVLQPALPVIQASLSAPSGAVSAPPPEAADIKEIKSPMVGTFYRSPSPETPPYIQIGQAVTEETVVCIIEAMKVMNEIKAEVKGVITEVLIENAKPVEFGKPLFRVKVG